MKDAKRNIPQGSPAGYCLFWIKGFYVLFGCDFTAIVTRDPSDPGLAYIEVLEHV